MDTVALIMAILVMSMLISPITMMEDKRLDRINKVEQAYTIDKIAGDLESLDLTEILKDTEYTLCEPSSVIVDDAIMFNEFDKLVTDLDKEVSSDTLLKNLVEFENISRDGTLNPNTNEERYIKTPTKTYTSKNNIEAYPIIKNNFLNKNSLDVLDSGATLTGKILKVEGLIPNYIFPTLRDRNTGKYYSIWITDSYYIIYEKQGGENLNPLVPSKNYKKII